MDPFCSLNGVKLNKIYSSQINQREWEILGKIKEKNEKKSIIKRFFVIINIGIILGNHF